MPYCLPVGRTNLMEKCLILITSSDCPHDDEILEESESLKLWNSISKLAGMVIKHFFSKILTVLKQLFFFFPPSCFFFSEDQLFFWRLLTWSLHVLCHSHLSSNQELNKISSGSLLSHIGHWIAQGLFSAAPWTKFQHIFSGKGSVNFSIEEYFQMDSSLVFCISVLIWLLPYFFPIKTDPLASQKNTWFSLI